MTAYLVTFDVARDDNRPRLVREIKNWPWVKLSETALAIDTVESPQTLYKRFAPFLGRDDILYIVALRQPFAGYGPDGVNDWLQERLPR